MEGGKRIRGRRGRREEKGRGGGGRENKGGEGEERRGGGGRENKGGEGEEGRGGENKGREEGGGKILYMYMGRERWEETNKNEEKR